MTAWRLGCLITAQADSAAQANPTFTFKKIEKIGNRLKQNISLQIRGKQSRVDTDDISLSFKKHTRQRYLYKKSYYYKNEVCISLVRYTS